ncbi:hypothetical protein ACHQM5_018432 [Ranunculus cassubicifolius]
MEITKTEPTWEEILGSNQWKGLLDPLDLNLRQLILRCGDFCQGTYDAFDNDQNSKYCGSSRYGKKSFFQKVALQDASNYFVDTFLYATARMDLPGDFIVHSNSDEPWDRESNWMGYIAVTSDAVSEALGRREIYIPWRGTLRTLEWINVFNPQLVSAETLLKISEQQPQDRSFGMLTPFGNFLNWWGGVAKFWIGNIAGLIRHIPIIGSSSDSDDDNTTMKVMKGWLTIYTSENEDSRFTKLSARTQLLTKLKELVEKYKDEKPSIIFAGHSLGASLSVLSAFDVAENVTSTVPVTAIIFGSPEVGNKAFNDKLDAYPNLNILHVKNVIDLIPHYPSRLLKYEKTGIELDIDTRKSPSLKDSKNPSDWHNLQAILHVVAGWNGNEGDFELRVKRSIALVNKSSDYLKEEILVPASWWVEKNKGMVLGDDGEWVMAAPIDEDLPVPEF